MGRKQNIDYVGKGQTRKAMRRKNYYRAIKMHLLRQTDLCGICGKSITDLGDATLDHIIPVSKGGDGGLRNLQLAHEKCNLFKGDQISVTDLGDGNELDL